MDKFEQGLVDLVRKYVEHSPKPLFSLLSRFQAAAKSNVKLLIPLRKVYAAIITSVIENFDDENYAEQLKTINQLLPLESMDLSDAKRLAGFSQEKIINLFESDSNAKQIVLKTLYSIQGESFVSIHSLGYRIWAELITKAVYSGTKRLCEVLELFLSLNLNESVYQPNDSLDAYLSESIADNLSLKNNARILQICLTRPNLSTSSVIQSVISSMQESVFYLKQVLVIPDRSLHYLSFEEVERGSACLSIISNSLLIDSKSAHSFLNLYFLCLQLSICDPVTIGTFKWREDNQKADINLNLNHIKLEATSLVSLLEKYLKSTDLDTEFTTSLTAQWNSSVDNLYHSASPLDLIGQLKKIYSLSSCVKFQKLITDGIFQCRDFWIEKSLPFIENYSPSMALADPMLVWVVLTDNTAIVADLEYDVDGLCGYTRRALLFLEILKNDILQFSEDACWIYGEIVRFLLICQDSVFLEKPHPFLDHAKAHADRVEDDITSIFESKSFDANCIETILSVYSKDRDQGQISSGILSNAFFNATESVSDALKLSNSRVFAYLLNLNMPNTAIESTGITAILLGLIENSQFYLVSAILSRCVAHLDIDSPLPLETVFTTLLQKVIGYKRPAADSATELSALIILGDFLTAFEESGKTEVSVMKDQERNALLRWIRVLFDAKVARDITPRDKDLSVDILFDSEIARLLNLLILDINREAIDIGLNMGRFLADLSHHWLKEIDASSISQELALLLHHTLKFWNALKAASEEDADSFVRVKDLEDEVETVLFNLFVKVCQPDMLTTSGFAILQTSISGEVDVFDLKGIMRQLVDAEGQVSV